MMTYSVALDGYGTETATAGARKHAEQQAATRMLERIEQGNKSDG